jgi:1,4-dihydroxy-2-naphthoate octaprenyltransferase
MQVNKRYIGMQKYIRALRLPFITASIFPFIFGSLLNKISFRPFPFLLGLLAAITTHLGANLLNDYADSRSGCDWQDRKWYTFFGGSKLIQEGILTEQWYLRISILCFSIASICVVLLAVIMGTLKVIGYFLFILFLGFSYSHKPLQLSYHRLGEFVIFILFGPALVMGAYFIQTDIFPGIESFILSLPFGFFTTAILYSNEVPDFREDIKSGKRTWVSMVGLKKAFILYYLIAGLGFASIVLGMSFGFLNPISCFAFLFMTSVYKAATILKVYSDNKLKLIESSKLTIGVQALVSIVLIISILL